MSLAGKNAVVFGGCGDIGQAVCQHLLKAGAQKLYVLDVVELPGPSVAALKEAHPGCEVLSSRCDITNRTELERILKEDVLAALGAIDVLVNSAGVIDSDVPETLIDINLSGTINSSLIALSLMSRAKGGCGGVIANVASIAGLEPVPFFPIYCASKHGIVGFTRSLGVPPVYDETGVKFLTICPGGTRTKLYDRCRQPKIDIASLQKLFREYIHPYEPQSPDVVGACVVQAIVEGENGSAWICNAGKVSQHSFPKAQYL